jgi:hypothetical protein
VSRRRKIEVSGQILAEENLSNALLGVKNTPFLTLQKPGFIMGQYG